ncbi:MAG: AI-2E family transporter [Chloroflexota bacterium]|nr:AI-2E family transporter [Chloroflexota bacterium]
MIPQRLRKPRLALFLFVFLLTVILFWQAREALVPFAVALVIAYLMLPLVNGLEALMPESLQRRALARPLSILLVYLLVGLGFTLAARALLEPVVRQINSLIASLPALYTEASLRIRDVLDQYHAVIPLEIQQQVEQRLRAYDPATLLDPILVGGRRAVGAVSATVVYVLGLIIIPFWLFFILNDERTVMDGALDMIPHDLRPDAEAVRIIVDKVLSSYIRGQLLVASVLGTVITIGLFFLGVQYSLLLGIAAGMLALFPFVGAFLGAVPAVVFAFLQSPELALYVILLFLLVQQVDNAFFSPKIIGEAVALHPALIVVVLVVGSTLFGVVGALLAVPVTAMLRDIVHYFYLRIGEEPATPVEALARVGYADSVTPRVMEAPQGAVVLVGE